MGCLEIKWDPFDPYDPGPCIDVVIMNSPDVIEAGRAIGLEYPAPRSIRALLDTGAGITVISKVFAKNWKIFQTDALIEVRALGAPHQCGEHAASVSFPNTNLRSIGTIRVYSGTFVKEPNYACLIGRDILRNWKITFNGRSKLVTIED